MDTGIQAPATYPVPPETPDERVLRLERERVIVEKSESDLDAGLGIELDQLEAWFEALDRDPEAPPPQPRAPSVAPA